MDANWQRFTRRRAIAARVVAIAIALGTSGCGGPKAPAGPTDEEIATAERVFANESCGVCHGDRREGTDMAPALSGLAPWWTEDRLVQYLADPERFAESEPRFVTERPQTEIEMPAFDHVPESQRRALARWLLRD